MFSSDVTFGQWYSTDSSYENSWFEIVVTLDFILVALKPRYAQETKAVVNNITLSLSESVSVKIPFFFDLLQFLLFYKMNLVFTSAQVIQFTWLQQEFCTYEIHVDKMNKVSEMVKQNGALMCGCCVQNDSMNFDRLF